MGGTVGGLILFKKTKFGARVSIGWLGVPVVRDVVGKSNISRITRTFGTLLAVGPFQALQITKDTLSNGLFMKAMGMSRLCSRWRGNGRSDGKKLPTMVASMVEIEEETSENLIC